MPLAPLRKRYYLPIAHINPTNKTSSTHDLKTCLALTSAIYYYCFLTQKDFFYGLRGIHPTYQIRQNYSQNVIFAAYFVPIASNGVPNENYLLLEHCTYFLQMHIAVFFLVMNSLANCSVKEPYEKCVEVMGLYK